jgi:hypothetical protein
LAVTDASYDAARKAIVNPLPRLVVTPEIGTAVVPDDLPRRISPDGQMHACIRSTAQGSFVRELKTWLRTAF